MKFYSNLVDVHAHKIFPAEIRVERGKVVNITPNNQPATSFILPGFVDAHIHIESSMLPPSEFARLAVCHGSVATVSDPHEIANVLGLPGIEFMLNDAKQVPFKFYFGAPSCVPATNMETNGANIGPKEIKQLFESDKIKYLSEVMNYPGVIQRDPEMMEKIALAKRFNKRIDGHAPQLSGEDLKAYIKAGIETDHECTTFEEGLEKCKLGMKILIREGSAAKNFEALFPLMQSYPDRCMFCSDDLHPDNLILGHINLLVKRAIQNGMDPITAIACASKNPVEHYDLEVGLLRIGDPADFIIVKDLTSLKVLKTYIEGECVFDETSRIPRYPVSTPNQFYALPKEPADFAISAQEGKRVNVIKAQEGQLLTLHLKIPPKVEKGQIVPDLAQDILKITVVDRYQNAPPAIGFIKNFGLKKGAIASSIAHDSHNIVAVGVSDEDLCAVVNGIIEHKGGIGIFDGALDLLPLPIGGLMSDLTGEEVASYYHTLNEKAKALGTTLTAPFMTLAFMALLVIPELKISDKGIFDSNRFSIIPLLT